MKKSALLITLVLLCLACLGAQAEVAVSPFGYTMSYDPSAFFYTHEKDADTYEWQLSSGELAGRLHVLYARNASLADLGFADAEETMVAGEIRAAVVRTEDNPNGLPFVSVYVPAPQGGTWMFTLTWDPDVMSTARDTMLNMVSTVYPGAKATVAHAQCDRCGGFYPEGNIFRNHICTGSWFDTEPGVTVRTSDIAPAATKKPSATQKPSSPSEPEMVYCELCGGWYEAGNIFRNHICVPQVEYAYCEICGGWYETGNVFRNHICVPQVEYVTCEICGGTYEAGNVFRNHICNP